ncbi:MAG: hypothetical protein RQ826_02835 [Xanthomonadales bacterium]|nr:hypothetical protein [Xanthomonadales bacterium]
MRKKASPGQREPDSGNRPWLIFAILRGAADMILEGDPLLAKICDETKASRLGTFHGSGNGWQRVEKRIGVYILMKILNKKIFARRFMGTRLDLTGPAMRRIF